MQRLSETRAGLMSPEERQDLYGLVAATMEALTRDEHTKQQEADGRGQEAQGRGGIRARRRRARRKRRHPRQTARRRGRQGLRVSNS